MRRDEIKRLATDFITRMKGTHPRRQTYKSTQFPCWADALQHENCASSFKGTDVRLACKSLTDVLLY